MRSLTLFFAACALCWQLPAQAVPLMDLVDVEASAATS